MTEVDGVPLMVGARLGGSLTTIENGASCALSWPSLTPITMLANVPTLALAGVPDSRPVLVLNAAQPGRFVIVNVSVPPFASLAVGVNA
jgi:hypothetical protein